jgi:amino acid adenylation domain-containing protein/non-ribosomal peptide synthase protein (TIGR01720 family)
MVPGNPLYNVAGALHLQGNLKYDVFIKSLHSIVDRHEVLRTVFRFQNGKPVQIIQPKLKPGFAYYDIRSFEGDKKQYLNEIFKKEAQKPMDLKNGPLINFGFIKVAEQENYLSGVVHHIISDGWSIAVLINDILRAYGELLKNGKITTRPLSFQHIDYAIWLHKSFTQNRREQLLTYWKERLCNELPILELPLDKPHKQRKTYSGDMLERRLPAEFLAKLNVLAKEASISLYTLLLGAFKLLLHKYSGQSDVIVGSSFANRKFAELNNQIGFYANAVPIRSNIQCNYTIREFLNELNINIMGAQEHQDMPFNILVNELGINRDTAISPIFQTLFEFQKEMHEHEMDGLSTQTVKIHTGTAKFDISLEATAEKAGLHLFVEYSTELFNKKTIKRLFDHYQILLERLLEGLDQQIREIQILTEDQRHHLLYEKNNKTSTFPRERTFPDIFETVAERCKHRVATFDAYQKLSYLELKHRSNGIAQKLLSFGLAKETRVPVYTSRSVKLLTAILGIFKSGAAYVPISPEMPKKRVKQIIDVCKSKVILTTEENYLKLQDIFQASDNLDEIEILSLDEKYGNEESFVYPSTSSRDLCYVIFTSGSTGVPKGVMIEQRGMINHLYAKIDDLRITENDIIAQTASQSFDISIWQFLAVLLKGGTVSIIDTDVVMEPPRLIESLLKDRISIVQLVPSILNMLVEEIALLKDVPCFPDLRYLMVTGETVLPETCRNWFRLYPHIPIVNAYGPTECSDDITHYFMTECPSEMVRVPIGTPVANTRIYILDKDLNLVPEGVVGEIYSSGEGVGRGYIENPAKTSTAFIPDPFSKISGTRMYKTGDFGRWLSDGTIEYLNRSDFQVKIRGFRIELEEIEAVLKMHPHVSQTVVLAKEMENKNKFLVAYYVPIAKKEIEPYALEQHLTSYLPAYMVPAIYVKLDKMPLNQNGKIDRNKLPQSDLWKEKEYQAPSSEAEKSLADIWRELLGIKIVSTHDSFFELGGNSLQVIQMVSRARSKYLDISLQLVFQNQTIAKLAERAKPITSNAQNLNIDDSFKISKELIDKWKKDNPSKEASDFYGLTALQAGLLFNQTLTKGSGININQHVISISGKIDIEAFRKSWQVLFEHHDILRTSFHFEEDVPFQVVHKTVVPVIEQIDLAGKHDEEISCRMEALIAEDRTRGFDVKHPPLMRLIVVKTGENQAKLLWTIHQILADGWSIAILGKELLHYYYKNAALKDLEVRARSQYRDYIRWLSQQDAQLSKSFWQKHLKDLPDAGSLPVSGDQTVSETKAYKAISLSVNEKTVNKLEKVAKAHRLTLNVIVQAAWSILYSHYTSSSDIVYGVNVSGRPAKLNDVENIVGLFINTLPVRVQLKWEHSFLDFGHQLQAVFLEMIEFEHTPIWDIAHWAGRTRRSKEEQLFEAIVGFDNYPLDESIRGQGGAVKIDDFYVVERTGYPFVLDIVPGKELDLKVTFDQRKYDLAFIQRMLTNLRVLIEKIAENPFQQIGTYSILAQPELDFLTAHGSNDDPSIPHHQVFQDLYRRQVEKTPDNIAVRFEDKVLSYMELNCVANRLAAVLHHKYNIVLESKVVLLTERSIDLMATILAVWKAGGAYIPLDPAYPAAHYAKVLKICKPKLILSEQSSLEKIKRAAEEAGLRDTLIIQSFETFFHERYARELKTTYSSSNAAYVIFTSGSTGLPKGACVEQKGMVNHIHSKINLLKLTKHDVTAQLASQCFDISVWQFFAPLLTGGSVIILDAHYSLAPFELIDIVEKNRITVLEIVPSQMLAILDVIENVGVQKLATLRWLIATGEALPIDVAQKWRSLFPAIPLLNAYGPTECSDDVTHYVFKGNGQARYNRVPIGTAIENTRTYVLDENLTFVPVGVPGELYIGGIGVGRGYVDDPVKTALNFLPDPFVSVPGSRMYKTGDKVLVREDGNLDFISRLDFQVKVRGFRIELGDVETAILKHPEVKEAAATVIKSRWGDANLIAHVTTKIDFNRLNLSTWLRSILPEYMIPSLFIPLDRMPLTRTGKLDRKALPLPKSEQVVKDRNYQEPKSDIEIHLAEKWKEILDLNQVSVDDNFFEVGGHSLHAVRILFWIKQIFQVELSLVQFFEQPVLGMIAQKIEQLKNCVASSKDSAMEGIAPVSRDGKLPLSSGQKRLWILESINPGLPVYNLSDSIRLHGKLDIRLLERVYQEIVRRHAVFRTSFRDLDGEPIQVISPDTPFSVNHIYLEAVEADQLEDEAERLAVIQARKPFDLCQAPLIRIDLIHIRPDDILLVQTIHHIISDGWSMGILVNEVAEIYSNLKRGNEISDSDPVLQYIDYANWQNKFIQSNTVVAHLRYWKHILAGDLTEIRLPYDFPVGKERSYEGDEIRFDLPSGVQERMEIVCREKNCTPYMFLLTVFNILLHKYSGETDIIVGTPIANRRLSEVESMIGYFVNTLVLRTDLSGDPEFDILLHKVKKIVVDGLQHQDAPFDKVVEAVNPDRNVNSSALFQIMFNLLVVPEIAFDLPDVHITSKELNTGTARFDLTLTFIQQDAHYTGVLNYRVDLFRKETIRRMAHHFLNLLETILDFNTNTPLSKLNPLSLDEYHQVTQTFSHAPVEKRDVICLHHWFERQVAITPDETAVVGSDGELTYACLDKKANQLARRLIGYGVGPEIFVGLCCDRSTDFLVGMLAILKAGGAYVPLDPAIPSDRKRYILSNSGAKVLLSHEKYCAGFVGIKLPVLEIKGNYSNESAASLNVPVQPNHPIYAIFTSGSTGNPKGVVVEHKQLFHLVKSSIDVFELKPGFSYAMVSTFAADLKHTVLFPALCTGGSLHIIATDMALEPDKLAEYFHEHKIDCLKITPNHMKTFLQALQPEKALPQKRLILGGEGLTLNLARMLKRLSQCKIYNEYGPTETTVAVCSRRIDVVPGQTSTGTIDIGRPFPGSQLYVLDSKMNPSPVGIAGELYIGGIQVSRGYLNNAEKTAERFVPNPFSEKNDKMYKTGDLVKWLPSGHLEFISRLDNQVKVRGYRVELGEIEAVLNKLEQVKESVLVIRRDQSGNTNLVAYVIPAFKPMDTNRIRTELQQLLPDYMLPHGYVEIDNIPLNANGKINTKNLPEPDLVGKLKKAFREPVGDVEKIIADIWSQVLGMDQIDISDNFFTIGGDSMMIMQTVAKAARKGIQIRSKQMFEHQTVRELAKVVKRNQSVAIIAETVTGDVPLTPVQRRFFTLTMENRSHGHICFLLDISKSLDVKTLSKAFSVVLEHHDQLRARYKQDKERGWIQSISSEKETAVIECCSYADMAEVEQHVGQVVKKLDLFSGPLIRAVYYQGGKHKNDLFFFVIHHLVFDVYSIHVLMEDFFNAYMLLARRKEIALPPKTTSYQQWAGLLSDYSNSFEMLKEKDYWLSLSQSSIPKIPIDFPDGKNVWSSVSQLNVSLSRSTTHRLLREIPGNLGIQIHEALISAVSSAISEMTQNCAVLMELEGHGRENLFQHVDLSRTIGWFTALYPVLLEVPKVADAKQITVRIAQQLKAVPNNGIGFGILRHLIDDEDVKESLGKIAFPEVTVNYQGQFDTLISGSSIADINVDINVQKYAWDPEFERPRKLQILGSVMNHCLNISIEYSRNQYLEETIKMILRRITSFLFRFAN